LSRRKKQPTIDGWQEAVEGVKEKEKSTEINVIAKTEGQKRYIQTILNNDITFCSGPAGSGKTYLSAGIGLQLLLKGEYKKIVIMRPATEACGEKIGWVPGTANQKLEGFTASFFDSIGMFLRKTAIKDLIEEGHIEVIPLGFLRGRSLSHSCILIEESQDLTVSQTLLILTRIGLGSKMVFSGDLTQSDIHERNGLEDAFSRLQGVKGVGFCELDSSDIVRHSIIAPIIERYKKR